MPRALLALGSNLGDRGAKLDAALAAIDELPDTQVLARSTWHATRPVGGPPGQGEFLNGAALLETKLEPAALRRALRQIEQRLGREHAERWAARALDIDLLLYDDRVIDEPELQVPHPRMSFRPFVLAPAAEVAADMVHPVLGVSIGALWRHLQHAEDEAIICGGAADDRERLVKELQFHFRPPLFSRLPLPAESQRPYRILRIEDGEVRLESTVLDRYRKLYEGNIPSLEFPKLQIFLATPAIASQPVSQPFSGIPTLVLDPRDGPTHLLIEAAAALEAVWPDLCRPEP